MRLPPSAMSRDEVRDELARIRRAFSIAIDRAKNGFNIGAIIRTAHSFLVKDIALIGSEPWYERAAMGMQRYENIVELPDAHAFLAWAAERHAPIVAFEKDRANIGLWHAALPDHSVLVFGNEDSGICPAILDAASEIVSIPMYGINHSYPVTAAAAIAMAEWTRRREAQVR